MNFRKTVAEIDLKNLIHNYNLLANKNKNTNWVCPMVKANAYGHGAIEVSKALEKNGCQNFGVALIEEGIELRKNLIKGEIFVFGFFHREGLNAIKEYKLTPVVGGLDQLKIITESKMPISIHLKFNTGMNRLGINKEDIGQLIKDLEENPQIEICGISSHLLDSTDILNKNCRSKDQLNDFLKIINKLSLKKSCVVHVFNSGGILCSDKYTDLLEEDIYFGFRPGISLYGISPEKRGLNTGLRPVMRIRSEIILIRDVARGNTVSYGGTWKATKDSTVGVVPMGYGDGLDRRLSNNGEMLVNGNRVPIVGVVCMDHTMVDLTPLFKKPKLYDEICILGDDKGQSLSAWDIASKVNTIPYEIVTRIGPRVPRIYIS